jgi:hypothetical protein
MRDSNQIRQIRNLKNKLLVLIIKVRLSEYSHVKDGVIITYTLGTIFNALVWTVSVPRFVDESRFLSLAFWVVANFSNLILIALTLPVMLALAFDIDSARKTRSLRPLGIYTPAAICIAIAPQMYTPFIWFTTFLGPS